MKFKAMTYNICSGKNLARERDLNFAASVIRDVQPDFVTLNEVRCHTDDVPLHQAQELGRLTGYYPVFGKSIDIMNGEYGNAFLTRFPLLEYAVVHIPDRRNEEKAFYEHRSVLRCVLDVGGKNVTVLSTHFGLAKVEQESAVETVLTAHVYQGGVEVTGSALTALGTIKWYKDGSSTALSTTGPTLTISAGDVTNKATYIAQLEG